MTKRKIVEPDLIDRLLADYQKPEDLLGENGILKQLTKAIVERALQAELAIHLGHDKHEAVVNDSGNTRNGSSAKTLKSDFGALPIDIPRDRDGSFEPQLVAKHQIRWTDFDFLGHRCRHGRSQGMAGAPSGGAVPDRLSRLHPCQGT
jgi:putative transposase